MFFFYFFFFNFFSRWLCMMLIQYSVTHDLYLSVKITKAWNLKFLKIQRTFFLTNKKWIQIFCIYHGKQQKKKKTHFFFQMCPTEDVDYRTEAYVLFYQAKGNFRLDLKNHIISRNEVSRKIYFYTIILYTICWTSVYTSARLWRKRFTAGINFSTWSELN